MSPRVRGDISAIAIALSWEREMEAVVLSPSAESLIKAVRMLPPDAAGKGLKFVKLHSHLSNSLKSRSGKGIEARRCRGQRLSRRRHDKGPDPCGALDRTYHRRRVDVIVGLVRRRDRAVYSKSDRGNPDCRMMLDSVPARTGL